MLEIDTENLEEQIEEFGCRYLAINTASHYEALGKKFDLPKIPYQQTHCLFDYDTGKVLLFTNPTVSSNQRQDAWSKTFPIKTKDDLSFLDPYKVDKSYFYQIDKVKPSMSKLIQMYGIGHIWLACVYMSESNIKRMIINKQLFGSYQIIGTREFNLIKLLTD